MPGLYITTFLQLLVTYWTDKYFFMKYCTKPKNLDSKLERKVVNLLPYIIIVHLLMVNS